MNVYSLLNEHNVLINISAGSKQELLALMVQQLEPELGPEKTKLVHRAVLEREQIMTTGVGKGIGLPHCKSDAVNKHYLVMAVLQTPLDFGSADEIPVNLVVLLVSPAADNSSHIRLLSRISKLVNNDPFRKQLFTLDSNTDIIEAVRAEEEKHVHK